jgi:hypothetical protein
MLFDEWGVSVECKLPSMRLISPVLKVRIISEIAKKYPGAEVMVRESKALIRIHAAGTLESEIVQDIECADLRI